MENIIKIKKNIQSQQYDEDGNCVIDLRKDDIVELKEDGIYFTRKIKVVQLEEESADIRKNAFESIKRNNEI